MLLCVWPTLGCFQIQVSFIKNSFTDNNKDQKWQLPISADVNRLFQTYIRTVENNPNAIATIGKYQIIIIMITNHVCAVGSLPCVGVCVMVKGGCSSLNPPGGSWEQPVTNCSILAISSCVKLLTIVQNHDTTFLKVASDPLTLAFCFRSVKLTVLNPHISS